MHPCNSFVPGSVTWKLLLSSDGGSQIMLASAEMKDLDLLPRGEDKRKRDAYEKYEIRRRSAGIFSAARSRRDRRQFEQGYAECRRDRYCRWQTAPGRQVSSGMGWKRT